MKDICSAKVIVDTKQMKDAIMQRMMIFLFFIFNLCEFFALNTLFKSFFGFSKRKLMYCLYTTTSAILACFNIAFSPIPHLRSFFFCAVVGTYFKGFCFKFALGAARTNEYWSPAYTIYIPKLRLPTTTRTLF